MTMLCEHNQAHLMDGWPMPGTDDSEKHRFFTQVRHAHGIMRESCLLLLCRKKCGVFYRGRSAKNARIVVRLPALRQRLMLNRFLGMVVT